MQYSISINQLFIASNPAFNCLDFNDIAIFDCVRKIITGTWGDPKGKELREGVIWAHVPVKLISEQMPLLRDSSGKPWKLNTIHKRLTKLCDCGLLLRGATNKSRAKAFLGLGEASKDYDFIKIPSDVNPEAGEKPLDINPMTIGYKSYAPLDINPEYNKIIDKTITISPPIPPEAGVSGETPKKPARKKARKSRQEATDFYEKEFTHSLIPPDFPPPLVAAAALRNGTPHGLMDAYKDVVSHMMNSSVMWPSGMWLCVLTKPDQLGFLQFCDLILVQGMTRANVKEYLNQWENKKYDNDNLYATFSAWWRKEKPTGGNGYQQEPSKKGLSIPKEVHQ